MTPGRAFALCNIASARGERQAALVARYDGLQLMPTETEASMREALAGIDWREDDLLAICGGDGTLSAALTELLKIRGQRQNAALPAVAALPGGSTNMSAFDVNRTRRLRGCLRALARGLREGLEITERAVVRVTEPDAARCGFFVGAGAIVQGIEYCHETLYRGGAARVEATAGLAMLRAIWGVLRRQPPFTAAPRLAVCGATGRLESAEGALLFAGSTLDRLLVGVRPHWGQEPGSLRWTFVDRAARIGRHLPGLLGAPGFSRPSTAAGYFSHNAEALTLDLAGSGYTIDGELYAPPAAPLEIDARQRFRFARL
ncbi:MAG: diacylglycerol kinase family protein [Pseudomonadota bacterium]